MKIFPAALGLKTFPGSTNSSPGTKSAKSSGLLIFNLAITLIAALAHSLHH